METDFHVWLGAARHAGKSLLIQDLRGRDGKRAGKQPELPKETLTQKKTMQGPRMYSAAECLLGVHGTWI